MADSSAQVKEQRPPVPRLVFAEEVERVIQSKKHERESAKKSGRGSAKNELNTSDRPGNLSAQNSGSRRSQRDKIEEALRSGQWSNDPAVLNAVNSTDDISSGTNQQTPTRHEHPKTLPEPNPPLPIAVSISVNQTELYRAETDTATIRSARSTPNITSPPTLEPIPQVLPRIVHEPEKRDESENVEPLDSLAPVDRPSPIDVQKFAKSCIAVVLLFIIPTAFVLGLVNIPLGQLSQGLSGNLVYLLAYFPLWGLPSSISMFLFLRHQLQTQHPDLDKPSKLWTVFTVVVQSIFMPLTYVIISTSVHRFPLPFGTFVVLPVALGIFFILAFITIADTEQRRMPGYLNNFIVNILVLVVLELQRLLTVVFAFFFPQAEWTVQLVMGFVYHSLVFALRWGLNRMVTRFLFQGRSINQYKKHNRSFKNPTPTREASVPKLATPVGSVANMDIPKKNDCTQASDPASVAFLNFLVDTRGLSFWPLCFLPFVKSLEAYGIQLGCVLIIYLTFPLRFSTFWFHFTGKNNHSLSTTHHKIWILAELTSKVNMLEYRKQVCAEFSFYSVAQLISLVSFLIITAALCRGPNTHFYSVCKVDLAPAYVYAAIPFAILLLVSIAFIVKISKSYSRYSAMTLFVPWLSFTNTHFFLVLFTMISSLIYPYQLLLLHNQIVYLLL